MKECRLPVKKNEETTKTKKSKQNLLKLRKNANILVRLRPELNGNL